MIGARARLAFGGIGIAAAAALAGAGFSSPAARASGHDCGAPFGDGARPPEVTLLVATPRPDTLPAGQSDSGQPTFGQLADVRRVGGAAGDRVEAVLAGDNVVVLVPWGFDDDCRPIRWTGSWSWSPPDSTGFFRGELRRSDDWVGDHPTFDIYFAVWEGFPNSPWEHPLAAGQRRLGVDDLFDLYLRLPTPDEVAERPYGSVSDLVAWRREAGDIADDYPARTILGAAFERAEGERIRTVELPYAGTYRMRVLRDGDTVATFYLRTADTGDSPWEMPETTPEHAPSAPMRAESFAAAVRLAPSLEALTMEPRTDRDGGCMRSGGLHVGSEERADVEGARRIWTAEIPVFLIAACLGEDDVLRQLREASGGDGRGGGFRGEFRHEEDGHYTFRQLASVGGKTVWLTGERIEAFATR